MCVPGTILSAVYNTLFNPPNYLKLLISEILSYRKINKRVECFSNMPIVTHSWYVVEKYLKLSLCNPQPHSSHKHLLGPLNNAGK